MVIESIRLAARPGQRISPGPCRFGNGRTTRAAVPSRGTVERAVYGGCDDRAVAR
jgi:hypothetical protein